MTKVIQPVCSNKPRPSVQKGAKGHAWWKREVYHATRPDMFTLCGRDARSWLKMDEMALAEALADVNFCARCATKLQA